MHKIILSGGPSTGKSTTFEKLKPLYPDAHFVEEAAETVIRRELDKQATDPTYTPIMPVTHYRGFAPLVIEQQAVSEQNIPEAAEIVFLDRSFIDNKGYLVHNDIYEYHDEIDRYTAAAGYTLAFFCDWLGKFERTAIRRETAEEGLDIHRKLEVAYQDSGIQVVYLPAVSVEERMEIIRSTIDSL